MALVFKETCSTVTLSTCANGTKFPDPCNCQTYYECSGSGMNFWSCATDQLYDTDGRTCMETERVSSCSNDGLTRCNVTAERMHFLRLLCQETDDSGADSNQDTGGLNYTNLGLVIGLIVGYIVLVILLVIVVCIYKKGQRTIISTARNIFLKSRTSDEIIVDMPESLVGKRLSTTEPCCRCVNASGDVDQPFTSGRRNGNSACCPCEPTEQQRQSSIEAPDKPPEDCQDCDHCLTLSARALIPSLHKEGEVNYGYVSIEDIDSDVSSDVNKQF